MRRIVAICCFCELVRADTESEQGKAPWQEFTSYMLNHSLRPDEVMFSHTYCSACLAKYGALLGVSAAAIEGNETA